MPAMGAKKPKDLLIVDYVCLMCRLLKSLPEEDQKNIKSVRIGFFPHKSANELLVAEGPRQVARLSLQVLYNSPEPPESLVTMLKTLSDTMVYEHYATLQEKRIKKNNVQEPGANYDGLRKLAAEPRLQPMERFRLFFSFDEEAAQKLKEFESVADAVDDQGARTLLLNALAKISKVKKHTERIGTERPPTDKNDQSNALSIALHNEFDGFEHFESAVRSYIWINQDRIPDARYLLTKIGNYGRGTIDPLPNFQFMDSLSRVGLYNKIEEVYKKMTGDPLTGRFVR